MKPELNPGMSEEVDQEVQMDHSRIDLKRKKFSKQCLKIVLFVFVIVPAHLFASPKWQTDYDTAIRLARSLDKPIFLEFYADWCGYCMKLRETVYPSSEFKQASNDFILLRINGEKQKEIFGKFRGTGFPTLLFLDKNGYSYDRIDGFVNETALSRRMRDALLKKDVEGGLLKREKKDPTSGAIKYRIGSYYSEIGIPKEARRYYLMSSIAAKQEKPDLKNDSLYNVGVCSMELKDYKQAVDDWSNYLNINPTSRADVSYARYYRGYSLIKLGRKNEALGDLRFAAKSLPSEEERQMARSLLE